MRKSNQIYLLILRKVAAIFIIFIIIASGCRSTKYVPVGNSLLDNVEIVSDNKEIKPSKVKPFVKQKANTKVLGTVKMHLWIYNMAPKNGTGWLSRTLKKIGSEPVIYDENRTIQSEREIKRFLANKGFTEGEVETDVLYNKKKTKVDVTYRLTCNTPYRIAQSEVNIPDTTIAKIMAENANKTLIKDGELFDLDLLNEERARITANLKDEGYYGFSKESFHYEVDTTLGDYKVKDIMILKVDTANPERSYEQYNIGHLNFIVGYDAQEALDNADTYMSDMDTVNHQGINFLSPGIAAIKPEILFRNNLIREGEHYSKHLSDRTHAQLSAIKIIRYVNMTYIERDSVTLDCNIYISIGEPQTFSFDIEGTNISGNFGAAATLGYAHKNLFRGGEQFSTTLTAGREAIVGDNSVAYSKELGMDATLSYPKFLFPFMNEEFVQRSASETSFYTSIDYQERPEYTRYISTINMTYSWKRKNEIKHQLTPLMFNYINIPHMTDEFSELIDSTEYLKYSYDKHVVFGGRYAITFQGRENSELSKYFRFQVETSGNILNELNKLADSDKEYAYDDDGNVEDSYYNLFKVRYAQYTKFDATGVMSHHINESNTFAYRLQLGIGIPYGNSTQLPFEKRYFGGGANGVRAWMVRSLGPGTYYTDDTDYYNQSGDINIIASLEYRFKMFWKLEGALFADAGNTWTIRDYDDQPGAVFELDTFYKQIALGIGAGLRADIAKLFVLRLDFAYKVHDPSQDKGQRWVLGDELGPTTHIAIGYPF